jgi:hypothetical protein
MSHETTHPRRDADGQHRLEYVAEPERLGFGFRRPVVDECPEASDLGHERTRQHFSGRVVVHGLECEDAALERGDGRPHLVQRVGEPFLGLIALDARPERRFPLPRRGFVQQKGRSERGNAHRHQMQR